MNVKQVLAVRADWRAGLTIGQIEARHGTSPAETFTALIMGRRLPAGTVALVCDCFGPEAKSAEIRPFVRRAELALAPRRCYRKYA